MHSSVTLFKALGCVSAELLGMEMAFLLTLTFCCSLIAAVTIHDVRKFLGDQSRFCYSFEVKIVTITEIIRIML